MLTEITTIAEVYRGNLPTSSKGKENHNFNNFENNSRLQLNNKKIKSNASTLYRLTIMEDSNLQEVKLASSCTFSQTLSKNNY